MTVEEALAPFLHRQPASQSKEGQQPGLSRSARYRRWCAERIAAGELYVLDKARAVLDELTATRGGSGATSEDADEASEAEDDAQ